MKFTQHARSKLIRKVEYSQPGVEVMFLPADLIYLKGMRSRVTRQQIQQGTLLDFLRGAARTNEDIEMS